MRRKQTKTPWSETDDGARAYRETREVVQAKCNADGFDRGIEANDLFRSWHVFLLPQKQNRRGHELRCEVVSCENIERCQPGHGPR